MTLEQCQIVNDLKDPPAVEDNNWEMLDDVLQGDKALRISHEGGELDALTGCVVETYVLLVFYIGLLTDIL